MSSWVEPSTTTRGLTIAIRLPSGVGPGDWSAHVSEGGDFYEVEVHWPVEFSDVNLLHRKWLNSKRADRLEPYHPKILGFERALKSLRPRHSESVKSRSRIPLPFTVQTEEASRSRTQTKGRHTRLLYVDLKATVEQYAVTEENDEFEAVD